MKMLHFWGCLLLIIGITACEKKEDEGTLTRSGQFIYEGINYDLHVGSIRQNEWYRDCYEVSLYSYDRSTQLDLQFQIRGGIISGIYENYGTTVKIYKQQVNARFSLRHVPEEEIPLGLSYRVDFEPSTNGIYNLRICLAEEPDIPVINWSGKLSQ